jgi:hypothetical protein
MQKLATQLLTMQTYARIAHHLIRGSTFLADHPWLGELYDEYSEAYDKVVEHCVGLGTPIDLFSVAKDSGEEVFKLPSNWFQYLLTLEIGLRGILEDEVPNYTNDQGTMNLIAQLCEDSLDRCYKLKGRLG